MAELNPFASFAQGRNLAMQRRAEERLIEDREREAATRNRMAQIFAGGIPSTPEAQRTAVGAIAREDPRAALNWSKHFASMQPDRLSRRKNEAPFIVSEFSGVGDQAGYDRARANLEALGVDVADMPPEYNPEQLNMVTQAARYLAEGPPEAAGGPFDSKALQGQAANILLTYPPESPEYAAAYSIMSQPRTYFDQSSGQLVSVAPDMSAFARPGGQRIATPARAAKEPPQPMGAPGQQTQVKDVTPAPSGMTVTPIPGSKAAREAQEEVERQEQQKETKATKARIVLDEIGRVERLMDEALIPATGFIGGMARGFAGTAAGDIDRILNTIRANVGFSQLQQMRQESKTGGALGAVSERENQLLQSVLGSLDQSLSEDEFRYNLKRLEDTFLDIVHGPGNRPKENEAVPSEPTSSATMVPTPLPRPTSQAERDALPSGTRYIAPEGTERIRK